MREEETALSSSENTKSHQTNLEKRLKEKTELSNRFFEITNDALLIVDSETLKIIEANSATYTIFHARRDELRGKFLTTLVHPDYHDYVLKQNKAAQTGTRFQGQMVGQGKDGFAIFCEVQGGSITYNGTACILWSIRDISERMAFPHIFRNRFSGKPVYQPLPPVSLGNDLNQLELKRLLPVLFAQLKRLLDYNAAEFILLEVHGLYLIKPALGVPQPQPVLLPSVFSQSPLIKLFIENKEALIVPDLQEKTALAQSVRTFLVDVSSPSQYSWLGVPLLVGQQVKGIVSLTHSTPHYFTERHRRLAQTTVNQLVTAFNRLYERGQEIAVMEERQRMARELHDSVTQVFYGIELGLHTLQALITRDPSQVEEQIKELMWMAEGGMAEMRALIFELRPESLQTEGLAGGLLRQCHLLEVRHNIKVTKEIGSEPDISFESKEAIFRITQEAFNNIIKHSYATEVELSLKLQPGQILLEIKDNGSGFDITGKFPGHIGLHSMRERTAKLNGRFQLESKVGQGTGITVSLPIPLS